MNAKNTVANLAVLVCIGISGVAEASEISLSAVNGYWDEPTAWVGGNVPSTNDYAIVEGTGYRRVYITNGVAAVATRFYLTKSGAPARTGHCVMSGGNLTLSGHLLMAAGSTANKATFALSDGSMSIANGRVGQNGSAAFTQTGGTLATPYWIIGQYDGACGTNDHSGGEATFSTDNGMVIGDFSEASGVYKLSGNAVANVPGAARIGNAGQGRFEQSGGSVIGGSSSASYISLGVGSTGSGVYLMSGGSLATYNLNVGVSGSGIMTQSLGTVSVTNLNVPNSSGSASYMLSQGNLAANSQNIGGSGNGASGLFVQNGGTNFCGGGFLSVGPYDNAPGTYEMNGGEIQSSYFLIAGVGNKTNSTGTVTFAAGTFTVNTEFRVGSYGEGTLTQTGGTLICPSALEVGMRAGSVGDYTQSGGTSLLNTVTISRDSGSYGSRYVISGGTATMTNLNVTVDPGREGTFGVVGTNAAVTVVQQMWVAAGGTYEVTLTPEGFAAPVAGTLLLSIDSSLKVKASGLLPYGMDNTEIPILTFGSRNEKLFKTVTVETGAGYGELKSAEVVYYDDRITLKVRVSRPPYGTVIMVK